MWVKRPITSMMLLACTVVNTRCPLRAACTAISAVSASRISPTRMRSGSCRRVLRRPRAEAQQVQAQVGQLLGDGLLVQDPDDGRLAGGRGEDGDPEVDVPVVHPGLESAVLRDAALGDVQLGHDLDA